MTLTSSDCTKIGKMINHATGRCISKLTDRKLRHKQGDFSPCPSGQVRSSANRCVSVKSKKQVLVLKKRVADVNKKIKKNKVALEKVEKKLRKLVKH